jgi:hypothetical protein
MAGAGGIEPTKCRNQKPVPYHLATPQNKNFQKLIGSKPIHFLSASQY